jgi:hypothetical protein
MHVRVVLMVVVLGATCFAQERLVPLPTPKRAASQPARPRFVVGVYSQPPDAFEVWRLRGINTLVGYESRGEAISNKQWSDAAAAKGFYYLRKPGEDLEADARDPNLLGWMHDDEPDVRKPPTDPKRLQDDYAAWKQAAPQLPVFVNFSGGNVLGGKVSKTLYLEYLKAADWVGNDFYPVTGYNRPDWLWKIGAAVDTLRDWSGGKPQLAFIETSAQRLSWTPRTTRGVSADELRAEIWHAVIHGAVGIVYFPQQIGEGFHYDATPSKVALEMALQNKRLREMDEVLASPANPAGHSISSASPIEIGWRVSGGQLCVIALNFSDDAVKEQVLHIDGRAITDNFGPYEVRIFNIPLPK